MTDDEKKIPARFYKTASGTEPVRVWLRSLNKTARKVIGVDIKTVEYGWPLGMPLCRSIRSRKGLWEIRSALPDKAIARVLFCTHDAQLVLLHGFVKKTQKNTKGQSGPGGRPNEEDQGRGQKDEKRKKQMSRHIGSSFDSFLEEEGILDEATEVATKRILAWQIDEARKKMGLSKKKFAKKMNTSEAALYRLLDPQNTSVTLRTITTAATILGKRVRIVLEDTPQGIRN